MLPARNRLVAKDPGTGPWTFIVLGGALAAAGTLLLGYGIFDATRKLRRDRKAIRIFSSNSKRIKWRPPQEKKK
jgi:hypothetical protein